MDSFLGAPPRWGLLLTTIDVRPRRLTCIATFAQKIVAASEDIVNIYDAVYFNLEQSLRAPEPVTKIQESGDGSILYLAHSYSVNSWDSQTGGSINTFVTQSEIIDMVVSPTGDHIACGLSDGSVAFWDIRTMKQGGLGNTHPLVAIRWLKPAELVVVTQGYVYVADVSTGETLDRFDSPDLVWGAIVLDDGVVVGASKLDAQGGRWKCSFTAIKRGPKRSNTLPESIRPDRFIRPTLVAHNIVCITPPSGVQAFDKNYDPLKRPSALDGAKSVAVSLNRNLAVQTEDSVQVFPVGVLASGDSQDHVNFPHIYIYPLSEGYVVCVQQNGFQSVHDLETLQAINPAFFGTSHTWTSHPFPEHNRESVEGFEVPTVIPRQSRLPPPRWTGAAEDGTLLGGLSPNYTLIATVCDLPQRRIRIVDTVPGTMLADLPLEDDDLDAGVVYHLAFDSEARFYLRVDGPSNHI